MYEDILIERRERVGLVRLNRPEARNALRINLLDELFTALSCFDDDPGIGAMVIVGNERFFSAGADIKEMADKTMVSILQGAMSAGWQRLAGLRKPLIAAVSGYALGGGCELALLCDLIVASETARFGQPEINIGIIPGAGGTQRLTHIVGKHLAMEMVINGRFLTAAEALQHGLANRVSAVDQYLEHALHLAGEIADQAPLAVQLGKAAVNKAYELSLTEGLALEEQYFTMLFATDDQKEGMQAFVAKRPAVWKGS